MALYPSLLTANVGIGTSTPGQTLEVTGQVFSSTGGFRFPNNTIQTTAATASAATTASNGLTKTGNDIGLGGTLTGAATVANAGFALDVTGTGSTSFGGNVGIGTSTAAARLDTNGDFKLGTNGTVLASIIKVTVNKAAIGPVATNGAIIVTFAVPNAAVGATVAISPANDLVDGANISFARVSSVGTVTAKFSNSTNGVITAATGDYYLTVIQ